jgi:polysaccharide export outer membrane protein
VFPRAVLLGLAAACLASCANGPRPLEGPGLAVLPMTELPPPSPEMAGGGTRAYHLGPLDKMDIEVFGVEELSRREVQADASGRVSFPLAGTIDASGMTTEELATEIENRLRGRYVRDPHVTVNLKDAVSQTVTVDGEVREPGRYPVVGRMTLMRAVASAKGLTEFARMREVVVFRNVGEQRMAALYDLDAIRGGRYADPEIYPDDIVVVGDSPGRRLFRDILAASPLFTAPIIALLQNNN